MPAPQPLIERVPLEPRPEELRPQRAHRAHHRLQRRHRLRAGARAGRRRRDASILNARNEDKLAQAARDAARRRRRGARRRVRRDLGRGRDRGHRAHRSRDRRRSTSSSTTPACSAARRSRSSRKRTWHELMKTNVDSVFLVGQAVARHMIARRRGKIINICSVQSELGRPEHRALHREQGRGEDADQGHGDRLGPARHPGQRPRARATSRPS